MGFEKVKGQLEEELKAKGLRLEWYPGSFTDNGQSENVVFGADWSGSTMVDLGKGVTSNEAINAKQEEFLLALESVGIKRELFDAYYPYVGRGKIWYTMVARMSRATFDKIAFT